MRLALGTAQFGLSYGVANQRGQVSRDEAAAILSHAQSVGIDMLDTAIAYGDAETRLGAIGLKGWRVVSKLPGIPPGCSDVGAWVRTSLLQSLERLRIASLHGLLLHQPGQLLGPDGTRLHDAVRQLQSDGLVHKVGVSIYSPEELDGLAHSYRPDIVQAPLNIVDQRMLDSGWLDRLHAEGIELHVRSVFLQGLLLMEPHARPAKFRRWQATWNRWEAWLATTGLTPLQACLRFASSFRQVGRMIVGVDTLQQLKEIVAALQGTMSAVPAGLASSDPDLVNPARWAQLDA